MTVTRFATVAQLAGTLLFLLTTAEESAGQQSPPAESADEAWTLLTPAELDLRKAETPQLQPRRFQGAELRPSALDVILARAPMEHSDAARSMPAEILLPTPDGSFERFALVESPVMHPDLQRWLGDQGWPVRTYKGRSLERPGTSVRLDWGRAGFHAMVVAPGASTFIDPYYADDQRHYASYFKRDNPGAASVACELDRAGHSPSLVPGTPRRMTAKAGLSTDGNLRTYRTAIAMTGDYTTQLAGGSVAQAQANLVTIINRINQIFERELSLRLSLVANNHEIIYTDPDSDPYTESSASIMLSQNQSNLNAVIGSAGYDFGHVIYRGGLGVAFLRVPCGSAKAGGVSGLWQAADDAVVVDMVAHEMGHQLGANHTFNSNNAYCTGNRAGSSAYEPGSGTTIMSYSGTCGDDNILTTSDDYFHGASLDAMLDYVAGAGACAATSSAGNANAPTVTAVDNAYTIPVGTSFELAVASSGDLDGDTLTYTWEQFDLGVAASIADGDQGAGPIIRSLPPGPSANRLVTGALLGETLPSTDRTLTFRVTVRDNNAGGGRIGEDTVVLTSVASAGPFLITAPNGGEDFDSGSTQTVTWDVAGTSGGAVQAANVDILLSSDGGQTFPVMLLAATPNDGSQSVILPMVSTAGGRILVRGSGNVFFDMSDDDFSIGASIECATPSLALGVDPRTTVSDDMVVSGGGAITDLNLSLDLTHNYISDLIVTLQHIDTGTSVVVLDRPGTLNFFSSDIGCMGADVKTTLDDEAAATAEDQCSSPPAIGGIFSPNNPLSAFDGEDLDGTWRLSVETYWNSGGTVNTWCLKAQAEVPEIFSDGFESGDTTRWSPPGRRR